MEPGANHPQQRRCRVSRTRTIGTVRSAINTWCRVFSRHPLQFNPTSTSCMELAREVKSFLADCPSDSEEERMAFQSIKKLLPDSCSCMNEGMLAGLMESVVGSPKSLPRGYLRFVKFMARRLFPSGWDTSYRDHCFTTGPPLSSTLETPRSSGGGLACSMDQVEFIDVTLGSRPVSSANVYAKPMVVQSAGKPRPLTKFSEETLVIKPLHKAMYDRLSKERWLLRGDVDDRKLLAAGFEEGFGNLVSGDYKSATDNLPLEVAELILSVALNNATRVPETVAQYAKSLLRPIFLYGSEQVEVSSGQQMGSLLSFPLLCAQNYIAFKWAQQSFFGEIADVPLLVNGDDILFQEVDPGFFDEWVGVVGAVGLTVERTKTSNELHFGSINSTLVAWKHGRLVVVPTLRFGMLRRTEFANSLPDSLRQFARPGLPAQVRFNASVEFLKWHAPTIVRTNLSPSEIGFSGRFEWRALLKSGLVSRFVRDEERSGLLSRAYYRKLPPIPCVHNIVIGSDDGTWVDSLRKDEEKLCRREQASWKWRKRGQFKREIESATLKYLLGLSRPAVQFSMLLHSRTELGVSIDWYSKVKRAYFEPREVVKKKVFLFAGIDRLPTYDEVVSPGYAVPQPYVHPDKPFIRSAWADIDLKEMGMIVDRGRVA